MDGLSLRGWSMRGGFFFLFFPSFFFSRSVVEGLGGVVW